MRHDWNINLKEAREIQSTLAHKVIQHTICRQIRYIAGFDIAYYTASQISIAGMVVLTYPALTLVDQVVREQKTPFPYIPGFLSFREAPALMALIEVYRKEIDLFIFDGHGIAHPRGLGIAAHIGVLTNRPAVGCAKKKLVGTYHMPENQRGAMSPLIYNKKVVGQVVRTKINIKPVFVSVGHLITLEAACDVVINCVRNYRLPEPTRLAHKLVGSYRRKYG